MDMTEKMKNLTREAYECYDIPQDSYRSQNLKRGLRNADGTGVLAGVTRVSEVHGYVMSEDEKLPIEGKLTY